MSAEEPEQVQITRVAQTRLVEELLELNHIQPPATTTSRDNLNDTATPEAQLNVTVSYEAQQRWALRTAAGDSAIGSRILHRPPVE